jgi:hypothetical protein
MQSLDRGKQQALAIENKVSPFYGISSAPGKYFFMEPAPGPAIHS